MQDNYRLNPLSDVVFSCMFQDMQGAPAMKELINSVLINAGDEPISEIVNMRSQYPQLAEQPNGKTGRLDIKARTADGELINAEVQLTLDSYFVDREIFYGDKMIIEELKSGETYQDMPKTRVIAFMGFVLRNKNPDIVQPIKFMYTKNPIEVASDKIRIYNVEIPKFTATYDSIEAIEGENNPLYQWLYMLTRGYQNEEEMEMLETKTAGMDNFTNLYRKANADQKLRDRYEYQMSQRMEEASRIRAAKDEGIAQGQLQGAEKKARETAIELFNDGIEVEKIAQYVHSSVDTVKEWLSFNNN